MIVGLLVSLLKELKTKHRGCIVDVIIPTNLVRVLFGPAIPTSSFNFQFFQGAHTLSRKKKNFVREPPHSPAGCIVEPYNASWQPVLSNFDKIG